MQSRSLRIGGRPIAVVVAFIAIVLGGAVLGVAQTAEAQESPHGEATPQTTRCSACHGVHATGDVARDAQNTEARCVSCHDVAAPAAQSANPLNGHDIQTTGAATSASTLACSACHSPHKTTSASRYVSPDNRALTLHSPIADVLDGTGSVYVLVGAAHDALAPVISAITLDSSTDGTAPLVSWTTSEGATSWVDWGVTASYELGSDTGGTPFGNGSLVLSHRVQLQGLVPGTTYHYRVRSADALGNTSVSADRTFTAFVTPPLETLSASAPASVATSDTPLYADEFNGPLDSSVWKVRTPFNTQYVTGELQWYDPANISFLGGNLSILTERRPVNGYEYASGMITSLSRPQFTYGYFEARAKLPTGKGLWPAFWLTNDSTQEIDIMEMLGERPDRTYMTYHRAGQQVYQQYFDGTDFSSGYHTFGMDWEPNYIRWYVDGILRAEYVGDIPSDPMWLIFNTAVGGAWPQAPDSTTPLPQNYDVDYVRVYSHMPAASAVSASTTAAGATTATSPTASNYSVDTDSIKVVTDSRASQRSVLAPVSGWESASAQASMPTPATPGAALDAAALARASVDDSTYASTHLTPIDKQWNWQLFKFDAGTADASTFRGLSVSWNGHGEPTAGYPTAVYVWEAGQWRAISTADTASDTDVSGYRGAVSAEFCLTCHDQAAPEGITMPSTLTNVQSAWQSDLHGAGVGGGFGTTSLKSPYSRSSEGVPCTTCHDTHGTPNVYHIPTSVNAQSGISATSGSGTRALCGSCHQGTLSEWHAPCVNCHANGHWLTNLEYLLPSDTSDCTQCHGHSKSWTHEATCLKCHGLTELKALGASPDSPWTYGHTF